MTYCPWNIDHKFIESYEFFRSFTLLDIYRCYELWKTVEQTAKLSGDIIEIGVYRGGSGLLMAKNAKLCGIPCTVYLCDTFNGVVKAGEHDFTYKGGEFSDTSESTVEMTTKQACLNNVKILKGVFPDETGFRIADRKFRLCHIDVDVYQSAHDILEWIWPRMVHGGVIIYDDYASEECKGITKHVEEQMGLEDRLVFYNLNGHAIMVKLF